MLILCGCSSFELEDEITFPLDITYKAPYSTNLWYVVDALSEGGLFRSSYKAYQEYWIDNFGTSDDSRRLLQNYKRILQTYGEESDCDTNNSILTAVPVLQHCLGKRGRIRNIVMSGYTLNRLWSELSAFIEGKDIVRLKEVIDYFNQDFIKAWKGLRYLKSVSAKTMFFFQKTSVKGMLLKAASFYNVDMSKNWKYQLNFIWRPDSAIKSTRATSYSSFAMLEIAKNRSLKQGLDVVFHELCHVLWRRQPEKVKAKVMNQIFETGDIQARSVYDILNEALASAWGSGIFQEKFSRKLFHNNLQRSNGFYGNKKIDTYAKAIFPLLKEYIGSNKTILDGFAVESLSIYSRFFFNKKIKVVDFLNNTCRVYSKLSREAARLLFRKYNIDGWSLSPLQQGLSCFERYAAINVTFVVMGYNDLRTLQESTYYRELVDFKKIKKYTEKRKGLVYYKKRRINGYIFILFGIDKASLVQMLNRFITSVLELKEEGVLFFE